MEVVENAASTDRMPADGIYVRERVTYPDSDLSSASRSTRRSHTSSERSLVTAPSSAPSLSYPETVYPIRDTGTNPARVSRRPRAPVRHEITTPNSARILSIIETTENDFSATSLPATSLTSSSQNQASDATEGLAIRPRRSSITRNAEFQDEQHLISVFVQDLQVALHARFGRVPETRKVSRSIAVLLKSYSVILKQFQNPGNHLERCAVKFVGYRGEQVYAVTEVLDIC